MTHDLLFLKTLKDLRFKLLTDSEYSLIRACGLLRHLLTDQNLLVDLVNSKYKVKIRFDVYDNTGLDWKITNGYMSYSNITVNPFDSKYLSLTKQEFLATLVLGCDKYEYTVLEVIRAASHYMGGIHSGKPTEREEIISKLGYNPKGQPGETLTAIRDICNVSLHGLARLEGEVLTAIRHTPTGGL